MKILFLADVFPYPAISGGRLRTYNILKQMGKVSKDIFFYCINEENPNSKEISHIQQYAKKINICLLKKKPPKERVFNILKNKSDKLFLNYSSEFEENINTLLKNEEFDVIYADSLWMYQYIYENKLINKKRTKLIVDLHNVENELIYRMMETGNLGVKTYAFLEYKKIKKLESQYTKEAHCIFTVSERDKNEYIRLYNINREKIKIIDNGIDISIAEENVSKPTVEIGKYILFVGSLWYRPNYEGLKWFVEDIWSSIKEEHPDLKLLVIGKYDNKNIVHADGVEYLGFVDDLAPYYNECVSTIVPLRVGSGTRLKILESMAFKVPVISTTIGCEGINAIDNVNIMIANNKEEFKEKITLILTSDNVNIGEAGYKLVEEFYDWNVVGIKLNNAIQELL